MNDWEVEKFSWTEWRKFPNPKCGEYLYAPFGSGIYQLKNSQTEELILFGKSKNVAYRMSSLLPAPSGTGTRNNNYKREYVLNNIDLIYYRTLSIDYTIATSIEKYLKSLKIHKFNS